MKKKFTNLLLIGLGAIAGSLGIMSVKNKKLEEKDKKIKKFKDYYNMLNQWLALKQEGMTLEQYFVENHYKSIAIYGMGEMGSRLYEELKDSSIEIKYAIDKNPGFTYSDLDVMEMEDELEPVDAVIVTAIFAFDDIDEPLSEKMNCPVISLEDVVYDI